jgi:RNA polymerase sigma-70 factor, ECF subfamily
VETIMIENPMCGAEVLVPDEDLALVRASKKGDAAAFEGLVKRYDRKLLRMAQNLTHNLEDAEEAVQEAFFKAYQKLSQFREQSKFSTWLTRIVLNEALMKLRKQRSLREQSTEDDCLESNRLPLDLSDWAPGPESLYGTLELRNILTRSLLTLSPALRVVFILRDVEGHTSGETAEILDLKEVAVRSRLSRARLQLREELSKYFRKSK